MGPPPRRLADEVMPRTPPVREAGVVAAALARDREHDVRAAETRRSAAPDWLSSTGAVCASRRGPDPAICEAAPVALPLASLTSFIEGHSGWALVLMFVLLGLESSGLPLPGETALVACGVLASQGALSITWVIVVASLAAVLGDNLGYWVARKGGRRLLFRFAITRAAAERHLPRGERFFARHGGKTVFVGRFFAVLRVTAAWAAGLSHMRWWRFLAWNAAGGICWATLVGLVAYYVGDAAAKAIGTYSLIGGIAAAVLAVAGYLVFRRIERRMVEEE
jgi:membrane protein DedA with SNARE-associated domain